MIRDLALVERAEVMFERACTPSPAKRVRASRSPWAAWHSWWAVAPSADIVREGAKSCVVEAEFRLSGETAKRVAELLRQWDLELDDDTLIIRPRGLGGGPQPRER